MKTNIISVANLLSLKNRTLSDIDDNEIADLEKKMDDEGISVDKKVFFKALKNYPDSFQFVLNDKSFFNFFTDKNLNKNQFSNDNLVVNVREIQFFIKTFLFDEISFFIDNKMKSNEFEKLAELSGSLRYLPDDLKKKIEQQLIEKIDYAYHSFYPVPKDFSKINYLKNYYFFVLVNNINDPIIEEKMKALFTAVKKYFQNSKGSEFSKQVFAAMKFYEPTDKNFQDEINLIKEKAELSFSSIHFKKRKYYWLYAIALVLILYRGAIFYSAFSEQIPDSQDYETEDYYEEPKIDRYYTNMKYQIDSFQTFLAGFNEKQVRNLKKTSIKTGDNPFETFYNYVSPKDNFDFLRIENDSDYDLILLESNIVYDSIKMPKSAYFIKAKDVLHFKNPGSLSSEVFNVYFGKNLSSFQTESFHLFIRKGSVVENRFSELHPQSKTILKKDIKITDDVKLSIENGDLELKK
jgi:hypothetical protein